MSTIPTATSIPQYVGDILMSVWPTARRLQSNAKTFATLLDETDSDDADIAFAIQFLGFLEKPARYSDTGRRLPVPSGEPADLQTFAILIRFSGPDDASELEADGYTKLYSAVTAIRAASRVQIGNALYDIDVHGGQSLQDQEEITADVFEVTFTAE